MEFTQLNSTKDTLYFYTPKEFVMFVFWLLGFSITGFVIKIVLTLILELIVIIFIIYFILKLYIFVNVFIQDLANIFRNVLYIPFRILSIFIFYCFAFFAIVLLICILSIYYMFLGILSISFIFYLHVVVLMLTKVQLIQFACKVISLHLNCG